MKHYLFIDESGDHGLKTINPDFPLFLLCSVLINSQEYEHIHESFRFIKNSLWKSEGVIFHSRDIRKCDNEFSLLFDLEKKKWFYERLNEEIGRANFIIIASAIKKDQYIKRYGRLSNDVYEIALSFIIERTVFCLDAVRDRDLELEIIIEKRGRKEDKKLDEHFQRLLSRGTGYVNADRLKRYFNKIRFNDKKDNINGLQLADLVAYPIARQVLEPGRPNPAYNQIESKIYARKGRMYGLKVFP